MNMQSVRSQKGFSLIELMIVVAIIGILATIAIPNFNKFQVKARQSEAKTNLSAIYTGEKAFYVEWNQYYGDFRDIGVNLEGSMRYVVGFGALGAAAPPAPFNGSVAGACATGSTFNSKATACACIRSNGATGCTFVPGVPAAPAAAAAGTCGAMVNPTANAFTAAALSSVAALGGTQADTWTISDANLLCNNVSAL